MWHKIFAGLGAALVVVGHNFPGPVGWVMLAAGTGIAAAVDGKQVFAPPKANP